MPAASPLSPRVVRAVLAVSGVTALAVAAALALAATSWIGRPFPGFFVLPNRVVPSVGLTRWPGTEDGPIYQQAVVAVDGTRVDDNRDVYDPVRRQSSGTPFTYALRRGAASTTLVLGSRTFSRLDYWLIFGGYLATGLLYLGVGILAAWMLPDAALGKALLYVGTVAGAYALSGVALYSPGADVRLHALAEALFPAALVYLACVLPRDRGRAATPVIATAWWLSLALAVPYQLLLYQPGAYSLLHGACETYLGAAGLALGASLILERARARESSGPLLRAAVAGALLGIGVPAVLLTVSGLSGGAVPVNVCTATAFLFPLSLGYGLLREHAAPRVPAAVVEPA